MIQSGIKTLPFVKHGSLFFFSRKLYLFEINLVWLVLTACASSINVGKE